MTSALEWLLDLQQIRLARDAPLLIKWHTDVHAWMLFCAGLVALAALAAIYRYERLSRGRRVVLASLRFMLIALVIAVLCEPALVLQRNRIEPSHVALLVDASMSMNTVDAYRDTDAASRVAAVVDHSEQGQPSNLTRLELATRALQKGEGAALTRLLEENAVQLMTFSDRAQVRTYVPRRAARAELSEAVTAIEATGTGTDLPAAIESAIAEARGRRLAGIVLVSDCRSTQSGDLQRALELAAGRKVPVFPVRLGSPYAPRNVTVGPLTAQETVFVNDFVAVEAEVRVSGAGPSTEVSLRLVDDDTGEVLATENVPISEGDAGRPRVLELRTKPTVTGIRRLRVEASPLPDETLLEDNADRIDVGVLDDRLRVLYVDGYPRYEYRYVKNALLREQTAELSVLLLEADERFVQEGSLPIRRFPRTPEELNRYDVLLFGDVDPRRGWLTVAQMTMILDFVGNRGGGFGLVAGERSAPYRFLGTPLEKLVPVQIDPDFTGRQSPVTPRGFAPALTAEGRRSSLFRFAADRDRRDEIFAALPNLYWIVRNLGAKPGASVLLEHPSLRGPRGRMPIVVTGRYGAGKIFFQGTDDTWRWRRHTGEWIHDSYWVQVIRWLMPNARVAQDRRFVLRSDKRVYAYGSPVRIQLEFSDTRLLAAQGDEITLTVGPQRGDGRRNSVEAAGRLRTITAHRIGRKSSVFECVYVPARPGGLVISAEELIVAGQGRPPSVSIRVERPDLEGRVVEADYDAMERIAAATDGRVLEVDQLADGLSALRDRSVLIPDDLVEPLWDTKLVLILFVALLTMEWILRKAWGAL